LAIAHEILQQHTFYIGIANPITIAIEGVADESIKVSAINASLTKISRGHYNVFVSKPGETTIILEWDGKKEEKKFRNRAIPELTYKFIGCSICRPEGIEVIFPNMDFDMHCTVTSYSIVYVPKKGEPIEIKNTGPKFNASAMSLMAKAQQGDIFQFVNIRTICPSGDMRPSYNTLDYTVNK
jgi:hypothetical protein